MNCSANKQKQNRISVSLVFGIEYAPVEIGGEGKEIPTGLLCQDCPAKPAGRLRKHANYLRSLTLAVGGDRIVLKITRLRCSKCKVTHACLFPCLVPHGGYSTQAVGQVAAQYLSEDKSYEQVGWERSAEEGEGHRHLVYRTIEHLCQRAEWIIGMAEKQQLNKGESLWRRKEPDPEEPCSNARKARSKEKAAALNLVKAAVKKFKDSTGEALEAVISSLHEMSMQLRAPFSLFSAAKVVVVRTTHKRGDALF